MAVLVAVAAVAVVAVVTAVVLALVLALAPLVAVLLVLLLAVPLVQIRALFALVLALVVAVLPEEVSKIKVGLSYLILIGRLGTTPGSQPASTYSDLTPQDQNLYPSLDPNLFLRSTGPTNLGFST